MFRRRSSVIGLTYSTKAARSIERCWRFDGHRLPPDIHGVTNTGAVLPVSDGVMGVAKDNYPRDGDTYSFVAGFAEVEVDVETGETRLVDFLSVGDVGTVVNPRSLIGQLNGGISLGVAHALHQKLVYDPHYGLSLARRFHHSKPITILDVPARMRAVALDIPDPETPVGARGVGDPPAGVGFCAAVNAIADAIGVDAFRRAPVSADIVLMSLTHGQRMHEPLRAHL